MDFGAILEVSWEPKWSKNRYKKGVGKMMKNDDDQDGEKIGYRWLRVQKPPLSKVQGRYSLKGGVNPSSRHRVTVATQVG